MIKLETLKALVAEITLKTAIESPPIIDILILVSSRPLSDS